MTKKRHYFWPSGRPQSAVHLRDVNSSCDCIRCAEICYNQDFEWAKCLRCGFGCKDGKCLDPSCISHSADELLKSYNNGDITYINGSIKLTRKAENIIKAQDSVLSPTAILDRDSNGNSIIIGVRYTQIVNLYPKDHEGLYICTNCGLVSDTGEDHGGCYSDKRNYEIPVGYRDGTMEDKPVSTSSKSILPTVICLIVTIMLVLGYLSEFVLGKHH